MKNEVYVDHSATTFVKKEVLSEMVPYFTNKFGNASATYFLGRQANKAMDESRIKISKALNSDKSEIYFTSGGSESDNMIISGIARKNKIRGNHIITSKIEHMAVLNTCKMLEDEGFEVTYLDVDEKGFVKLDELENSIKSSTILISIMFANNEIGVIQDIEKIGKIAKERGIYFHTDAVQVIGNIAIDVDKLNIDALSISAHKFYGPKGIGAAFIRKNVEFTPFINGGHQENSKRAGTENVASIVGMAKAIEIANANITKYNEKLIFLRNKLVELVTNNISDVIINGDLEKRLPGSINFSFKNVEGQNLLLMLDMVHIYASSGSACTSGSVEPSYVLQAINVDKSYIKGSLRITFGEENNIQDVYYLYNNLYDIISKIRKENMK